MKSHLQVFKGQEVEVFEFDGKVLFNPKHVGACLDMSEVTIRDHIRQMNDNQRIKLTNTMISNVGLTNFRKLHNTGEVFLTESGVFRLLIKSRKPEAIDFQDWITDEVLPQIRQTGGYIPVTQEDDDMTIMAKALQIMQKTLDKKDIIIANQDKRIKHLDTDNKHKKDVIDGIVETLDKPTMRSRINQIVKYGANGGYPKRYGLLYGEFEKTHHVNLKKRLNNAIDRGELKKSAKYMDLICDHMDKTQELYEVAVRVFESDFHQLGQDIVEYTKRECLMF